MSQAKNWCFTLNNFNEDDLERIEDIGRLIGSQVEGNGIEYLVIGKETGESGTPHLQGFIQFTKKKRMNQVKDLISTRLHAEVMRGTATQASFYCKKDGDFVEWGRLVTVGMRDILYFRLFMSEE